MKSRLPLQGYTRSELRVTNSVRGLSGFWTSNPELGFLPLHKTGHFSLDFCEVLDHSRKCEYTGIQKPFCSLDLSFFAPLATSFNSCLFS